MISIGIIAIATNQYFEYWLKLHQSIVQNQSPDYHYRLHLFTDQMVDDETFNSLNAVIETSVYKIPNLQWPGATLLRFHIISLHSRSLTEDILMYVDADSEFVRPLEFDIDPSGWNLGLALVAHPGYAKITLNAGPINLMRRLRLIITNGAVGTWEKNRNSSAYVERRRRKSYVCGGVFIGGRDQFLSLSVELAKRVELDLNNGVIALWHDESHLNWFASYSAPAILDSRYCSLDDIDTLRNEKPYIIALEKGERRTR